MAEPLSSERLLEAPDDPAERERAAAARAAALGERAAEDLIAVVQQAERALERQAAQTVGRLQDPVAALAAQAAAGAALAQTLERCRAALVAVRAALAEPAGWLGRLFRAPAALGLEAAEADLDQSLRALQDEIARGARDARALAGDADALADLSARLERSADFAVRLAGHLPPDPPDAAAGLPTVRSALAARGRDLARQREIVDWARATLAAVSDANTRLGDAYAGAARAADLYLKLARDAPAARRRALLAELDAAIGGVDRARTGAEG